MKILGIHGDPLKLRAFAFPIIIFTAANLIAQTSVPETFSKKAMLKDIATRVIAPDYQQLAAQCGELHNSLSNLVKVPTDATMDRARQAWVGALLASSQVRCYQAGPIADRNYGSAFFYWQILPQRMEEVLNSSRAMDKSCLDELGATTKGLFALEYLLYAPQKSQGDNAKTLTPLDLLSGGKAKRRGEFMLLLAQDLDEKAAQLEKDWTAQGKTDPAAKFGENGQESLNLMVNQLARMVEDVTEHRLRFALALRQPLLPQLNRIEGSRSGTSLQSIVASLEGAHALFRGGKGMGLDDALKRVNPDLEQRVEKQFETTIDATKAVNMPVEQAVFKNRSGLQASLEKTRALEVLLKVDVVSALGVTLTFSSVDGD